MRDIITLKQNKLKTSAYHRGNFILTEYLYTKTGRKEKRAFTAFIFGEKR
jgi:hypothetical protein